MNLPTIAATLLALAVLAASVRMLVAIWRADAGARPRTWRVATLLLLQLASAVLLYRTLLPPRVAWGVDTLVVATGRATPGTLAARERLIALPEAPPMRDAERVPDLATALRRYPATRHLRVIGAGLVARDRESVRGRTLSFAPAPQPRGLAELSAPARVIQGHDFLVQGRVEGARGGHAELIDQAGQRVDREQIDATGRFRLLGAVRGAGLVSFRLRLHDAQGRQIDTLALPIEVAAPSPLRMLVLAGGPDAELKFLRRWAVDSGNRLHAQIELGGGMRSGDPPIALNAGTLKNFDVAIVDERAWTGLGDGRRRALADAVRDGLGLLVRVSGPLSTAARSELAALGVRVTPASVATTFALPAREAGGAFIAARVGPGSLDAPTRGEDLSAPLPELTRQPLRIAAADMRTLLRDGEGNAVVAWRNAGRGRAAVWLPLDSYQLVLAGREDVHAALWGRTFDAIARARTLPLPDVPQNARQGERATLCALPSGVERLAVAAPTGTKTPLLIDPATGPARCAGYWPRAAGWHGLQVGDTTVPFFVRAAEEAPGLVAQQLRDATQRLELASTATRATSEATVPGSRWPWFFGGLLVWAALWWLERTRLGRR